MAQRKYYKTVVTFDSIIGRNVTECNEVCRYMNNGIFIGSHSCSECEHNQGFNDDLKFVICDNYNKSNRKKNKGCLIVDIRPAI